MQDVLAALRAIRERGGTAAMATVVRTWSSAPRPAGASMLISDMGEVTGSITGGCVESSVADVAGLVLADGVARVERYGVSDDDAYAVGLTCGGTIDVLIERVDADTWPELDAVAASVADREPVAVATATQGAEIGRHIVVWADRSVGTLHTDTALEIRVRELLRAGTTAVIELPDDRAVLVSPIVPPAQMFVFGAADFSAALVRVGKLLGFRVSLVDARSAFATSLRFPEADEVVVDWPHRWLERQRIDEQTVIAVMSHDPKFDDPALVIALRSRARYVGALGSRRTHADRIARLTELGLTAEELARLKAPIGLDLGASTPEETAISIAAEIVQAKRGGTGSSLTATEGAIHPAGGR